MIKGSIQWQDVRSVNIYAPNMRAYKYIKQILTNIKGEIDSNAIIHILFKCTWNILQDHMLGHKTSLNNFNKIR